MLKSKSLGFTPVNNIFIEKYMPKARGEFIKIYLLMLKHDISGELGVSSSILASSLNLLESDIMNALNYWNDQGVIKFTQIDKMGNFNVEFVDLIEEPIKSTKQVDLLEALGSNNTKDMLKDIETLLARPLSPNEMSIYLNWQREFGFSSELILILMEYCISKGKSDSRYIEKVALSWHDQKITNIDQAQNLIKKAEDKWLNIRKVLTYLGINGDIMKPQQDLIEKWLLIYKFSNDIIFKACDICFERLSRADFKYIDGILTNWNKNNIRTLEDIALKDAKNSKNVKYQKNYIHNNNDKSTLKFNNFEAREYDYDSLEKKLLGWDNDD
jgi:DnaD/phage-associated family protein